MKKFHIGLDSGSSTCKAALCKDGRILDTHIMKTGWNPKSSALENLTALLKRNQLSQDDICISATGYGRESIDFANHVFTEITCHGFGGLTLCPDIQGVIDIGGQDSKVIQIQNNRIANFLMNDKCAAGTGRFLGMACDTLGILLEDIDKFAALTDAISINSMCTVFAESEIIGLLASQKDRSKIMTGVLQAIAQKIHQMAGRIDFCENKPLLMTGGLAKSAVLVNIISQNIGHKVITHQYSLFAGAIGACICAAKKQF